MNELIERLAEQCYEHDQSWTGVGQRIFNKEKFARLLIQECAKFLDENSGSDYANNVWYPEPEELLKHFGVKE
jgi:hypothetical protein